MKPSVWLFFLISSPPNIIQAFVFKFKQGNKHHASLFHEKLHSRTEFGILHFAGPVVYDASDFVERNTDVLPELLMELVKTSSNKIVARELGAISSADEGSCPGDPKCLKSITLLEKFRAQLRQFFSSIDKSKTRYIRCIKPTEDIQITNKIDHKLVLQQLKCAGLVTAVELSRQTFPNKLPFSVIQTRFGCLLPKHMTRDLEFMELHDKAQLIMSVLFAATIEKYRDSIFYMPFACGHTRVFFRSGALESLEEMRRVLFEEAALRVQQSVRKWIHETSFKSAKACVVTLQALFRRRQLTRQYKVQRHAAIRLQTFTRGRIKRRFFAHLKTSSKVVRQWLIMVSTRLRFKKMVLAARALNAWIRSRLVMSRFKQVRKCIIILQAHFLMVKENEHFTVKKTGVNIIARWWRSVYWRGIYLQMKTAETIIAAFCRAKLERMHYKRLHLLVLTLQAKARSAKVRSSYHQKRSAAHKLVWWMQSFMQRRAFLQKRRAATTLTSWLQARKKRGKFVEMRHAATVLSSYQKGKVARQRYMEVKAAEAMTKGRQFSTDPDRKSMTIAATTVQKFVRRRQQQQKICTVVVSCSTEDDDDMQDHEAAAPVGPRISHVEEYIDLNQIDKRVAVNKEVLDRVERYKQQIDDLNHDIMNVTAEAELHSRELEEEYEERLADYEVEVLELKQTIREYEEEQITFKDEISANVENIRNLKNGIRSMQESHRDYLNKVMRAIENANAEHEKAIAAIALDRDQQVKAFKAEIKILKKNKAKIPGRNGQARAEEVYKMARKLEKLISPDYIVAMAEISLDHADPVNCIEAKISSKARKIIYRLEDSAVDAPLGESTQQVQTDNDCIQSLQQQLVNAYEEIERLQAAHEAWHTRPKTGFRRVF
jgi:myosin heavy subunit